MEKLKKNEIDWLFNQTDCHSAITTLGARNLTVIKAVYITVKTQEEVAQYSDMVMHDSIEADMKARNWMRKQVRERNNDERYLYFRFIRFN